MNKNLMETAWAAMQMAFRAGYVHEDKDHTVACYKTTEAESGKKVATLDGGAEYWKAIKTGEVGQLITQIHTRETKAQCDQRIRLNNAVTPEIVSKCRNPLNRLFRPDGLRFSVKATVNTGEEALKARLENFADGLSIRDWVHRQFVRWNEIDPNGWWVVLFTQHLSDDGGVVVPPTPRPILYQAKDIVFFNETNDGKDLLCVSENHSGVSLEKGECHNWTSYTLYAAGFALVVTEATPTIEYGLKLKSAEERATRPSGVNWPVPDGVEMDFPVDGLDEPKKFLIEWFKLDSVEPPFGRWGVIPDEETEGRTMASYLAPAKEVFDESVVRQSEIETNTLAHVFLHRHQYQPTCKHRETPGGHCENGTLSISREKCRNCDGTGLVAHRSGTDVMTYPMPDSPQEMLPLSQMVYTETLPLEILKHLTEEQEKAPRRAMEAIWGVSDKPQITTSSQQSQQVTATEFRGRYEAMNNALAPFREAAMRLTKKMIRLTANYAEISNLTVNQSGFKEYAKTGHGLEIVYEIPTKSEQPSVEELTISRQQAATSNSPYEVLWAIDLEMIERQYGIDSIEAKWFKAKSPHRPFAGKSKDEVAMIIAARPDGDFYKTLWLYFDQIFDEIRIEDSTFMQKSLSDQRKVVAKLVSQFQTTERENGAALVAKPIIGA